VNRLPLVKIELARGLDRSALNGIMDTVMGCVVESLKLPADDRNIRLTEFDPDFFAMKKPYSILVEITLFSGRPKKVKETLYRKIVTALETKNGIPRESILTVLNEQPLENWGVRGGVPASDVRLNFDIRAK
jgi:phenylpyruvate tautomerase PptA (4-oxalocrotonate tautomerase family)